MRPSPTAPRRPRDTVARWIALTTLLAMLTLLALNELFSMLAGAWARPPLMETGLIEKVAAVARIIDTAPVAQRPDIARAASDAGFNVQWLQRREEARLPVIDDPEFSAGLDFLRQQLGRPDAPVEAYQPGDWPNDDPAARYAVIIGLADQTWLVLSAPSRSWGLDEWERNLIIIGLILLSTFVVALVATRHLATPLERFAEGARRFGVDHQAPPIPAVGPYEIRQAISAFNAMQAQLKHYLQDRTQMLAAISHDLRAPLTRMRLRGEFIEDPEQQSRLFRDVDEMQAMVNSALEFFRDDARLEHATAFDLAELLHTIVDDLKDAGAEVSFQGSHRLVYLGRPIGIKRALVNLMDNAIKYGGEATITLEADANRVDIRILDQGPGIAPEYLEQVFTPFFRIEGSRNKHTGGVGLGLSAARATVLEHGGTLTLGNRPDGGLEVKVSLPLT
ncbi:MULTISPECIES: cell wall metabolism sensor histidine kinase WalK [Pseudomonas]|uniref:sensor histidine kinase n=1 Tax=Pseudomonas TaxID=286 RepID=UPI000876CB50|nr:MULTISPECIES: ATP-binding protein [Pseudomonas]MDT8906025.1 ATP-binding protein [Pseudomonas prosekii]NHN67650.1 HAMP domain-containing protein [Pseudomonas fluorescens]ROO33280.1 two-component sensor histidine kinase [Pseudomonas sp. 7SR1]ROO36619.1 two-component sensor histidine kinase [Pseudomonas sp. AF76]SCX51699.1 Signal transduction histidine kinase [Pseudomonas sp. NFACC32-1]